MSIPNKQIGWSNESNLLWLIAKEVEYLATLLNTGGSGTVTSVTGPTVNNSVPSAPVVGLPTLQQVGDTGYIYTKDYGSYSVIFDIGDAMTEVRRTELVGPDTQQGTLQIEGIQVSLTQSIPTKDTGVIFANGEFRAFESNNDFQSNLGFQPAIANCQYNVPAKATPGTYTIATVDDVEKYLVYTALLTQSGTDAPTAIVLQNTTGLTFTFTRQNVGDYFIVPSSSFTDLNKLFCISTSTSSLGHIDILADDVNAINIYTSNLSQAGGAILSDGYLINTPIEIRIYP